MALTDTQAAQLQACREGLFACSTATGCTSKLAPNGGKWWRFKYRFDGKEKRLSFGTYPDVPLALARAPAR